MDAYSDPEVNHVALMWSTQSAKTEAILNCIFYTVDRDPGPIVVVLPSLAEAQKFSKERIQPTINCTPILQSKFGQQKTRAGDNTIYQKAYPGGYIGLVGANSPAGLAARPAGKIFGDEVDRFPSTAKEEGDPLLLAEERQKTFPNKKTVVSSTPTVKGASRIEREFDRSDQRYLFVPCPNCNEYQTFKWAQVKWPKNEDGKWQLGEAYIECLHCNHHISEAERVAALEHHEWRATKPFEGRAGFHLNVLYSPFQTLEETCRKFARSYRIPEEHKVFVNTSLAETWEEQGDEVAEEIVNSRIEEYHQECLPKEIEVLTCGVDVQGDSLVYEVQGWSYEYENWCVDWNVIMGNPASPDVWAQLETVMQAYYTREDSILLQIKSMCIDSGGHHTQEVYDFQKKHKTNKLCIVRAIKGMAGQNRPIIEKKRKLDNKPLIVGTDTAKQRLYNNLNLVDKPGPHYSHFGSFCDDDYFTQLTSERAVTKWLRGVMHIRFVKKTDDVRNEALDCRVYGMAAFELLGKNVDYYARSNRNLLNKRKHDSQRNVQETAKNQQKSAEKPKTPKNQQKSWVGAKNWKIT